MAIIVEGPDGAEIEFPDDTPPETIKAAMSKHYGAPKPQRAGATPPVANSREQPKERNFLENVAKGAERIATGDVAPEEYGRVGENFVRSVTGPLGGDVVAAAGSAVAGKGFNPNEQRARREELAAENPVTATAGELLGAGGVAKALAPVVGGVAAQGAATGAIVGANESGGDPYATAGGAVTGAVGGKVVEKIGEAFAPMAAFAKRLKGPDGKAIRPQELFTIFKEAEVALGHKPTMIQLVEALNQKNGAAMVKLAAGRKGAREAFSKAEDADLAARPVRLPDTITRGQSTTGSDEMLAARDDAFSAAMNAGTNPMRNRAGLITPAEANALLHPDVLHRLDDAAAAKLMTAVHNQKPAFLTVGDADTIRRTLGDAAQAAQRDGANFGPLTRARAMARLIGERIDPRYRTALADYEGRSDMVRGAAAGAKVRSASPGDLMDASVRLNPAEAQGTRTGARKALSEAAGDSDKGAVKLARELVEPGMQRKLAATLGPDEAARLGVAGKFEATGADTLGKITRSGKSSELDPGAIQKITTLGFSALAKTKSPGVQSAGIFAILKPLRGLGLGPGVGRRIAEIATEENGAEKVIAYLRRARVGEAAVQKIAKAIGVPVGAAAGGE